MQCAAPRCVCDRIACGIIFRRCRTALRREKIRGILSVRARMQRGRGGRKTALVPSFRGCRSSRFDLKKTGKSRIFEKISKKSKIFSFSCNVLPSKNSLYNREDTKGGKYFGSFNLSCALPRRAREKIRYMFWQVHYPFPLRGGAPVSMRRRVARSFCAVPVLCRCGRWARRCSSAGHSARFGLK